MAIRDDLFNFFSNIFSGFQNTDSTATGTFFDFLFPIILVGFIIVVGFIAVRTYRYYSSYAGDGEPVGPVKLTIQGMSAIKGNMSKHYFVSDQEYELLKTIEPEKVADNIQDFRKRVEEGQLFIYDLRITDYDEAFDLKGGKDSIVVSPVDLENPNYSWLDVKGERSITSPTFRVKHRNIMCFSASRYFPDQVMAEREVDIYDIVPIPKELMAMKIDDKTSVVLYLQKLANAKSDATYSEYLRTLSENWQEIAPLRDEVQRMRKLLIDKDIDIGDALRSGEHDRHVGFAQPVIGHKNKPQDQDKTSLFLLAMVCFFIGGVSALIPEFMPNLAISGMLTLLVGAGIMALILYMAFENKEKKKETEKVA